MSGEDFIKALWQAAADLGLVSRWEFWVAVFTLLMLLAWHKVAPAPKPTDSEGIPLDPKAPSIPMPPGGAPLDQHPDPDVVNKG